MYSLFPNGGKYGVCAHFEVRTKTKQAAFAQGHVDCGSIHLFCHSSRPHAPDTEFVAASGFELPCVDIATSYAGADGVLYLLLSEIAATAAVLKRTAAVGVGRRNFFAFRPISLTRQFRS